MADQLKNVIIGLFVLAALAIVVFIILFLHPKTGDESQTLYVLFSDVDKLNVGTRVTLAGRPVGEVVDIRQVEQGREGASDDFGHLYIYELKLLIDSHVKVYDTDEITAKTSGLLGEKSVAIIPIALKPGEIPKLIKPGEIIYANETASVEETLAQFKTLTDKVGIVLDGIDMIVSNAQTEQLVKKLSNTLQNLEDISASLNKPEQFSSIIANLQSASATADEAMKGFNDSSNNMRHITYTTNDLVNQIKAGNGTIGKLMMTDDLYLRISSLFSKGETVLNDINHYGLLFQSDKGWQRLRARRLNLLQRLQTPQEFRNYFNDEIDQISTSLSRVNMVLDKVEFCCDPCELCEDPDFTKVFAELLRRIGDMEESLKMYNQQLIEPEILRTELLDNRCH